MRGTAGNIMNFIGFQAAWFACVLGAAHGRPAVGCLAALAWVALHLVLTRSRVSEAMLIFSAAVIGYVSDSALVLVGVLSFPDQAAFGGPSALWMVCLWMSFATTLDGCLAWLAPHLLLGVVFGAIGGPIAYGAGARLGAITWGEPWWPGAVLVGVQWAIAVPVLFVLARRWPTWLARGQGLTAGEVQA